MSREVWKAVETKAGKVRIAEAKRRREKWEEMRRKEAEGERRKEKEEKTKGGEDNISKKDGREMGDLGWEGKSSKIWRRGHKISTLEIPQVDSYLWKESEWENANEEVVGLHDRGEEWVYAKKGEILSVVEGRKKRDTQVY